ncbi:tripartite motif-containing protein 16-like protein [Thunnus maccoyii]|uniref:tripartite motif-containing protein 16-like protein n=1 Tax=Thunnus maccoyii TaxID=8240 RepID=UPI001C4BE2DE|nr:tripartite motif-containing protein 16-like protein [Thunnus maccoyii]
MAQQGVQLDGRKFCCSICLDLLKDPVTTSCGHSYCMTCIQTHWDGEDQRKIYSCPQCRHSFIPRPVLLKNTMLADLVEELKKTRRQTTLVDHCYAGPGDVACDVCTGRKLKATKSCLQCLASYCELHLLLHYGTFLTHQLVEAAAERTERQREFEVSQQQIQQRIQDREKDVKLLQQEVEAVSRSADKAVEDSEKIFTELIHLIQKRRSDVKQQIRSQQETEVSRVKELQEKLEREITELKKLSHTEDHNQFLLNYPSLSQLSASTDSSSIDIRPLRYFEHVTAAVSKLRDQLQDILREEWIDISRAETEMDILLPQPEPKTRAEFLQYSCQITLDPNTAHRKLVLYQENKKVRSVINEQSYPDHPDRFTDHPQVLSRKSLTGRCYWEVEWTDTGVSIAVADKNISREGFESDFTEYDKSWALECKGYGYVSIYCESYGYVFKHNSMSTDLTGPRSSRVGVYLDHTAGILSFYSVSETMTLLHRVQTTFTQPLHAGICVPSYHYKSTARFC